MSRDDYWWNQRVADAAYNSAHLSKKEATIMLVVSSHYNLGNALLNIVQTYYRGIATGPLMSNTKKEAEARDNKNWGFRHGIAEAVAEIITVERANKFPLMDRQIKVNGYEVIGVLTKAQQELDWSGNVPDGDIGSQVVDRVLALVDGTDGSYAKNYEDMRRQLIRNGELQATEADREWITAEADKKREEVDAIMRLLRPVSDES